MVCIKGFPGQLSGLRARCFAACDPCNRRREGSVLRRDPKCRWEAAGILPAGGQQLEHGHPIREAHSGRGTRTGHCRPWAGFHQPRQATLSSPLTSSALDTDCCPCMLCYRSMGQRAMTCMKDVLWPSHLWKHQVTDARAHHVAVLGLVFIDPGMPHQADPTQICQKMDLCKGIALAVAHALAFAAKRECRACKV